MTKEKEAVHKELVKLDKQGKLTPQNVVDRARDRDNAMHEFFEWDDKLAGEKYRLDQARTLISDFQVVVELEETAYFVNEFVERPLKSAKEQGYTAARSLADNKVQAKLFVQGKLTLARTYADNARAYAVLLGLEKHVAEVIERIDTVLSEVSGSVGSEAPVAS